MSSMKYTQIPKEAFKNIQLNAGILLTDFNVEDGSFKDEDQIGATSGGSSLSYSPEYTDFGSDIDNCPANMKELKKIDSVTVTLGGTFVTVDTKSAKMLMAAADIDKSNPNHIIPRTYLEDSDFGDIWWVGDYSDITTGDKAGYIALHVMNALSTGGFQLQSSDKGKGTFSYEFTGHFSMDAQDKVPFEAYIKAGEKSGE